MKCIRAIKETKSYSLGEIRRTDDQDAEEKVKSGVWVFIPKSEWKATRKPVAKEQVKHSDEANEAASISLRTAANYQAEEGKKKKNKK